MLAWTIYISLLGAAAMALLPRTNAAAPRALALITSVASLVLVVLACAQHPSGESFLVARHAWIPSLGIEYILAADGISLVLLLLTGIVGVAGVLFSWDVADRPREFFACHLMLIGAVYGVFLSADLFLLLVFYESVIVPKYLLIAIWGSTRREYGAMKLAIYTFVGTAMVLVGLVAAYVLAGAHSTALAQLAGYPFPPHFQLVAFPLVFAGFAILAGMWPFHTWAPTGHVAAPTAASMLLAGVVMKLGAYGCLRVAMTLFPLGLAPWGFRVAGIGSSRELFALLGVVGIVYGALAALMQQDFKFVVGYASVSHMGFVLLGLMTLNQLGLTGAVVQMFSHGILAGLLFAVVGRMVYARTHTRELDRLGEFRLQSSLAFATVVFVIAAMAAMGVPGFSGFIAELTILLGAWRAYPALAAAAGLGVLIGVVYLWRAMQKAFFDESVSAATAPTHALPPITVPERIGALLLIGVSIAVGLYPQILLRLIGVALSGSIFQPLQQISRGGWQ